MAWELSITISILSVAIVLTILSQVIDDSKNLYNRLVKFIFFFIGLAFLIIALHSNFPIIAANSAGLSADTLADLQQHISLAYWLSFIVFIFTFLYYALVFLFGVMKPTKADKDIETLDDDW